MQISYTALQLQFKKECLKEKRITHNKQTSHTNLNRSAEIRKQRKLWSTLKRDTIKNKKKRKDPIFRILLSEDENIKFTAGKMK